MNEEIKQDMVILFATSGETIPSGSIYMDKSYTINGKEYFAFLVPNYKRNTQLPRANEGQSFTKGG